MTRSTESWRRRSWAAGAGVDHDGARTGQRRRTYWGWRSRYRVAEEESLGGASGELVGDGLGPKRGSWVRHTNTE